ncbi:MAG: hypothetical protein ACK5MD_08100 [Flavobacteriales bacterium]
MNEECEKKCFITNFNCNDNISFNTNDLTLSGVSGLNVISIDQEIVSFISGQSNNTIKKSRSL